MKEPTRYDLPVVALTNVGAGMVLGLGPADPLFQDVIAGVLVATGAIVLLWGHLSGRQLERQFSKARHVETTRGGG